MAFDEPRHQARRLCVFNKIPQERGTSRVFARSADRLLNRRKPSVEDACAGQFFQIRQKPRPKPRKRAQVAAYERFVGAIERF
jgi:hypothetical protein